MIQRVGSEISRRNRVICLPFCQDEYRQLVSDPKHFRRVVDETARQHGSLFPDGFQNGYEMKDIRYSKRLQILIRRILIDGVSYTIRPAFVMPYMTGMVQDTEKALFLRKFNVPYWALAYCYGRNAMYWYRMECGLGRFSIVGTTIQHPSLLPRHVVADEKHTWLSGQKVYCATTVADGCVLGATIAASAGQEDLEKAYGEFKQEAQTLNPDYSPKTGNTDGWLPTRNAWKTIFPGMTLLMCLSAYGIAHPKSIKKRSQSFQKSCGTAIAHRPKPVSRREYVGSANGPQRPQYLHSSSTSLRNFGRTYPRSQQRMIFPEHSGPAICSTD